MRQSRGHPVPLLLAPKNRPDRPLYVQLQERIRTGVLEGTIPPGTRLPSARTLAQEEGVSRNTVEAAFHQLQLEGFLVRRVGSGTWITDEIPTRLLPPEGRGEAVGAAADGNPSVSVLAGSRGLSARGRAIAEAGSDPDMPPGLLFTPCAPGLEALPLETWHRILTRHTRQAGGSRLVPSSPGGLPELKRAIATHVHLGRGVRCSPEQILILNSTQQGLDLIARLLLDPGDTVWVEDPGYLGAHRAFVAAGADLAPVPVDSEGIDVDHGTSTAAEARLACVTPSHQYPLGVTLSLARRLELLAWARSAGSWILEDDYDSEVRYDGRPLAALQGIDASDRVLYAGTFNKMLFPALRIAFLVLPPDLVEPFRQAREITDGFTPPLPQAALAEFIQEGHYAAHLRRVREVQQERRDRFLSLAEETMPDWVRLGPSAGGMHLALHFPSRTDDQTPSRRARARGLAVPPLSRYAIRNRVRGLLVHYGNAPIGDLEKGVRGLEAILEGIQMVSPNPHPARDRVLQHRPR